MCTIDLRLSTFFLIYRNLLRLFFFISYSVHYEIKAGNTFPVISNKHAIHDGFRGRKGRSLYSPLDPSLQEDLTIHIMAVNTHIQFRIGLEFVFKKKTRFFSYVFFLKNTFFFLKTKAKKTIYITRLAPADHTWRNKNFKL